MTTATAHRMALVPLLCSSFFFGPPLLCELDFTHPQVQLLLSLLFPGGKSWSHPTAEIRGGEGKAHPVGSPLGRCEWEGRR